MNTQTLEFTADPIPAPVVAQPKPQPAAHFDRYTLQAWAAVGALIANGDIAAPELNDIDQADDLAYAVATAATALIAVDTGDPKRMAWGVVGTLIGAGIIVPFEVESIRGASGLKLAVDTVAEALGLSK